jgi:hypothetical protein
MNIHRNLSVLVVLALASSTQGGTSNANQRLDRVLPDGEAVVVAGVLTPKPIMAEPGDTPRSGFGLNFTFRITHVLQGDQDLLGKELVYDDLIFDWPEELISLKSETSSILILQPPKKEEPTRKNACEIMSIVPAEEKVVPKTADPDELQRLFVKHVIKRLETSKFPEQQQRLILDAAPMMTAKEARAVIPFLKSEDEWVRRAALSGLAYATGEERYIRLAAEDLDDFLQHHHPDKTKKLDYPLRYFFDCYFFLSPEYKKEEKTKLIPLLPLFRVVAQNYREEIAHEICEHGLWPLFNLGVRQDVTTLYGHHNDKSMNVRYALVYSISRILKLDLPDYDWEDFPKHERELQEKLREALEREAILPKKKG